MALGERFRTGGTRGIARFLADHQHCDAGFDVQRQDEPGSGKLRITCLGCGETVEYHSGEASQLAAAGLDFGIGNGGTPEPVAAPAAAPRVVRAPARMPLPAPGRGMPPSRPHPPERSGPMRWLPLFLIGALIVGGLVMIAVGVLRTDDEQPAPQPVATPQQEPQPSQTSPLDQPTGPAEPAAPAGEVALEPRSFADRVRIGVPPGWQGGVEEGGVMLTAPGGTAEIRVFFEKGERSNDELTQAASGFLSDEHPGAELSAPEAVRVDGRRASRVRARYGGGEEVAVVLSAGGYSYLITERVDRGASSQLEAEADAALDSFQPLSG